MKSKIKKEAENLLIKSGLMYDRSEQIDDEEIEKRVGGKTKEHYEHVPKFGDRAWKVYGKKRNMIVWDCGNGWFQEMEVTK
jgi:hypothetical protein